MRIVCPVSLSCLIIWNFESNVHVTKIELEEVLFRVDATLYTITSSVKELELEEVLFIVLLCLNWIRVYSFN